MTNVYGLFTGKLLSQEEIDAIESNTNTWDKSKDSKQSEILDHSDQVLANQRQDFLESCVVAKAKRVKKTKVCEFTLQTRNNRYVKANCYLDMETLEARSYEWWAFVKKIGNKVVFNEYRYSATTSKHQIQMRILLDHLNIGIDMVVSIRGGLQGIKSLKELKALDKKQA